MGNCHVTSYDLQRSELRMQVLGSNFSTIMYFITSCVTIDKSLHLSVLLHLIYEMCLPHWAVLVFQFGLRNYGF